MSLDLLGAEPVPLVLTIVGGPNGCGKSTLARRLHASGLLFGADPINPDTLTKDALVKHTDLNQAGADLAGVERAEKAIWRSIARGESAAVETVLSSEKYLPVVETAGTRNYTTRLYFVTLPTVEVALARIEARVKAGGHGVPEQRVRARWGRAHDNLMRFLIDMDEVIVYSNLLDEPQLALHAQRHKRKIRLLTFDRNLLPELNRRLLLK